MKHLKELRLQHNLSQQKLADILHITQQSVYKYENDITTPDIETLTRMAEFFNTSVDYLIDFTDQPRKIEFVAETMLNHDELHLIEIYRKLTSSQRNVVKIVAEEFSNTTK